jgi:aminoglycoside phosphotransferase (APT) family kinase protein
MKLSESNSLVPSGTTLREGLQQALNLDARSGCLEIVDRCIHTQASTFPSELVTCVTSAGQRLRLLCKYSADCQNISYGHRGGVAYEAFIYRHVLDPLRVQTPRFHGEYRDPLTGWTWLILQYLDDCLRVNQCSELMMPQAAGWLGAFHRMCATRLVASTLGQIRNYDADYFQGWLERTYQFASLVQVDTTWIEPIRRRFGRFCELVADRPQTVIHGEFCPRNVLVYGGQVFPVDWESAAVSIGEIDLVALTEGWPPDVFEACEEAYRQARWPDGAPPDFAQGLAAARVYWHLRWLGENPRVFQKRDAARHVNQVRIAWEQLETMNQLDGRKTARCDR